MRLVRADVKDCETIWNMQTEAFADLLEKYRDYETNPANEPQEKTKERLLEDSTYFYLILDADRTVGAIRVVDRRDGSRKRVSPVFIMKEFRNKGLAQKAFEQVEKLHGADGWELATIMQEKGNCHLYEKLGYKRTGETRKINDRMNIVYYEKD